MNIALKVQNYQLTISHLECLMTELGNVSVGWWCADWVSWDVPSAMRQKRVESHCSRKKGIGNVLAVIVTTLQTGRLVTDVPKPKSISQQEEWRCGIQQKYQYYHNRSFQTLIF